MLNDSSPDQAKPAFSLTSCPWKLAEVFAVIVTAVVVSSLPQFWTAGPAKVFGLNLLSYLLQCACFFLLPLLDVGLLHDGQPEWLGFRSGALGGRRKIGLLAGVLLFGANFLTALLISLILPERLIQPQAVIVLLQSAGNWFELLLLTLFVVVFAPIAEEAVFRAFLYPPLRTRLGRKKALLVAGLLFGAVHLNLAGFLPLALCGLILAWLYDRYQDIRVNIIAHGILNGITMLLFFALGGIQ